MASNLNSHDLAAGDLLREPGADGALRAAPLRRARDDRVRAADGVLRVPGEPDGSLHAAQHAADARRAARDGAEARASAGSSSSRSPAARWTWSTASFPTRSGTGRCAPWSRSPPCNRRTRGRSRPGSALCLVYTFAQNEGGGLMRRVKGGMGMLSEALCRSIADKGGEVRLEDAGAAHADRGRARDRRRAATTVAPHRARRALEPRQAGDASSGSSGREHLDADDRSSRIERRRAARRVHAPPLQAAAACRATARRSST